MRNPNSLRYADILNACWPDCGWTFHGPDGDWDQFSWDPGNPQPQPSREEIDAKRALAAAIMSEQDTRINALDQIRSIRPDIYLVMAARMAKVLEQLRKALPPQMIKDVDWTDFDEAVRWLKAADPTGTNF